MTIPKRNLTGLVFGALLVLPEYKYINQKVNWLVKCNCGNTKYMDGYKLWAGLLNSCGCMVHTKQREAVTKHGLWKTNAYTSWSNMMRRCYDKSNNMYYNYGGRGITVCDRWHNVENFFHDMGERSEGFSLERLDNNLGYSPSNCKWATAQEQGKNKRKQVIVSFNGEQKRLVDVCSMLGVSYKLVYQRIHVHKWSCERALTQPIHKRKSKGI